MANFSLMFLLLALIAEFFGTIGGFGSSVFFVPIANFYFDFHSVLGLTAVFHLASNISKIALFKKGLNKELLFTIGIPSVIFVVIGGFFSKYINTLYLELSLAIFLIVLSLIFLIWRNLVIPPKRPQAIAGGILSGFSAGLLGSGGAIRGITMGAFNLEKSIFIATSAFIDFAIDASRTVVYYQNGYIHAHDLKYVPFLFGIGFLGTYLGKKVLNYIPQTKFRAISLSLILFIGIVTLVKVVYK